MSKAGERCIIVGIDDSPPGLAAWALSLPMHGGRHHQESP
jgi:hypothetical protein